jgi:hypothetical protein
VIGSFFLLNLILAVIMEAFTNINISTAKEEENMIESMKGDESPLVTDE